MGKYHNVEIAIIPKRIGKYLIENMAGIKRADMEFKEGINLIHGLPGSRKSTVLRSLMQDAGEKLQIFKNRNKTGLWKRLSTKEQNLFVSEVIIGLYGGNKEEICVLLDGAIQYMDNVLLEEFMNLWKSSEIQIISVAYLGELDRPFFKNNEVNVIDTGNFEFKRNNE